jgi:ribosomal protein S18 acetylase RimI-like enzyme
MELVYLGLVPQARGQDLGDILIRKALATAAEHHGSQMQLAVDSLNAPALKLYFRHGFKRVATKLALMRNLRAPRIHSSSTRPITLCSDR